MNCSDKLRTSLEKRFNRHALPISRAATGLYLLARVLGLSGKKILTPATICNSPINALALADCQPVFADASLGDFNPTPETLRQALVPGCAAILAADVFGHVTGRLKLYQFAQENGLVVLDDLAQSILGHVRQGFPPGLQYAVLSFGQGKPLSATLGGAILATDPVLLAEIKLLYERLPVLTNQTYRQCYQRFREVYYSLASEDRPAYFPMLRAQFKDMYVFRRPEDEDYGEALRALANMEREDETRRRNAAWLTKKLGGLRNVALPALGGESVPYRYTFLVPSRRDSFVAALRARGLHVSTLYPDVRDRQWRLSPLPGSRRIEDEVVNLWIDNCIDERYLSDVLEIAESMLA